MASSKTTIAQLPTQEEAHRIIPVTTKDLQDIETLEGSLRPAADNLRANSKLTSGEYCMPVLGVINHFGSIRSFEAGIRRDDCAL